MGYTKILIPLDGTEFAEQALYHIREIAAPDAQIHLISVLNTAEPLRNNHEPLYSAVNVDMAVREAHIPMSSDGLLPYNAEALTERQHYLQRISEALQGKGYCLTYEVLPGNPATTIIGESERSFDVVIMATHARTGLRRIVHGSIAEAVLNHAACPVLLVPAR